MDYVALGNEIRQDPATLGYAPFVANGADGAIADLLNAPHADWDVRQSVLPIWRILAWAATGPLAKVQAAAGVQSPIQAACLAALAVFQGGLATFDVDEPSAVQLVGALVAAGVLSQADQTAYTALGSRRPASRAEVLFGPGTLVSHTQVAIALGRGTE